MRIERLHGWDVSIDQAREIQRNLANKVLHTRCTPPHLIAGLDVSVNRSNDATAAAVVLSYPELNVLETETTKGKTGFPYIPGLLSFREIPLTLKVCEKLSLTPDIVIVDGQGIAHPRRMGLAAHLGLFLNVPTIGCAKSHLYGDFQEPGYSSGSYNNITDENKDIIGAVLRTKDGVRPLFISVGHKIDLSSAIFWVLQCCRGHRLPEPTRMAHLASRGHI
jgi:deoxyribonuclease V